MSIVNIRACYDLESALNYQELKNGIDRTACKCSNVEPYAFRELAKEIIKKYKRLREGYTIIHSFSREELDYTNQEHAELAKKISYELMSSIFPNSAINVVVHTDSKNHCVHTHSTVLNHNFKTGKALQNTSWYQLKKANDELMENNSMEVCKRKERSIDQQEYWSAQRTNDEYSWQEDMQNRIDKAMDVATSLHDFFVYLGVEGVQGNFYKADGKSLLKHFSFSFKDKNGKEHKKRGDKLGACYTPEAIQQKLKENQQKTIIPMSDWVEMQKGKNDMDRKILNVKQPQQSILENTNKPLKATETINVAKNVDIAQNTSKKHKNNEEEVKREKRRQRIKELQLELQFYEDKKFEVDVDSPEYKHIMEEINKRKTELLQLSTMNLNEKVNQKAEKLNENLITYESKKDKGYSYC